MLIVVFHKLTLRPIPGTSWHTPHQFEATLRWFRNQGFKGITPGEFLNDHRVKNEKALLITFDDGYREIYTLGLPILEKYGFKPLIFLIAGYIGKENLWDYGKRFRHLNWKEILELKKLGYEFGSHTLTHPDLTKLTNRELIKEVKESKRILEDRLGRIDFFSYPLGRYNRRVKEIVKDAGYKLAFGYTSGSQSDSLSLGRIPLRFMDIPLFLRVKSKKGYRRIESNLYKIFLMVRDRLIGKNKIR